MSEKVFKIKKATKKVKTPLNKTKFKEILGKIFIYILLIDIAFVILFPLFSKLSASLMSNSDLYDRTVILIPKNPTLENYSVVFSESFFLEAAKNTVLISLLCAIIQTLICAMTGYGLAKCK